MVYSPASPFVSKMQIQPIQWQCSSHDRRHATSSFSQQSLINTQRSLRHVTVTVAPTAASPRRRRWSGCESGTWGAPARAPAEIGWHRGGRSRCARSPATHHGLGVRQMMASVLVVLVNVLFRGGAGACCRFRVRYHLRTAPGVNSPCEIVLVPDRYPPFWRSWHVRL
jgi:hypothetical protein